MQAAPPPAALPYSPPLSFLQRNPPPPDKVSEQVHIEFSPSVLGVVGAFHILLDVE